jgi:rod shape-determining protein MreB
LLSVLSGVTQVEQRALLSAAEAAGIGRVCMIEDGLAAAFGGGVKIDDPHAAAVVDIGGATTSVAIVANGRIVNARAERIGSWDIDAAISDHVRRHLGLAIGAETAERVKLELVSAMPPESLGQEITIRGREILTGNPGAIEITAKSIRSLMRWFAKLRKSSP